MEPAATPYKTTPVFDETSLPQAIRNTHRTKPGVWGVLRVLDGEVRLIFHRPHREVRVTAGDPAAIPPEAEHHVELAGPMRMQVEFYRESSAWTVAQGSALRHRSGREEFP